MSRIDGLIAELCPNGVEYKTLGVIATDMYRGSGIKRDQVIESGSPCVRYGEIYTTYNIWFDACLSHTNEITIPVKKYFEYGDVLFAITGESVAEIAKSCVYTGHEKCLAGGDVVVMKHRENPKYLAYVLSTTSAQRQKSKGKIKSKVVHSSVPSLKAIEIPLPPLPVQQEIVRILDKFTTLEAELEAELKSELEARKKQYEHYRNELLNSYDNSVGVQVNTQRQLAVQWLKLGAVADIGTGSSNTNEELEVGTYPFFVRSQVVRRINTFQYDETAIITSGDGVGVGKIFHYIEGKYALHQRAYRIHINDERLLSKYFFHYMRSAFLPYIQRNAVNSSVTSVRRHMLENFPVPLPSIKQQKRIITILDRFDMLVNDIRYCLPAEISARHTQYEYYRDRLLTFEEKVS